MAICDRLGRVRCPRRHHGQALVEFALVGSILIVLAFGLIQYGWLFTATTRLTAIARDGARFAAKHGAESQTRYNGTLMSSDAAIRAYVRQVATGTTIRPADLPDANISISPALGDPQRSSGRPITVTVTYDLRKKLFVSRSIPGISSIGAYPATAIMIIE